jgi:hypothetical protein
MKVSRAWHVLVLLAWSAGSGCTALREIPRSDYAAHAQDRPIRVVTREGLSYELDAAKVEADTLVGYRRRDVEGPIDEFDTVRLPLDQVATISARRIDWYRTGLVGGLSMAAVVIGAMTLGRHQSGGGSGTVTCDPANDPGCAKGKNY